MDWVANSVDRGMWHLICLQCSLSCLSKYLRVTLKALVTILFLVYKMVQKRRNEIAKDDLRSTSGKTGMQEETVEVKRQFCANKPCWDINMFISIILQFTSFFSRSLSIILRTPILNKTSKHQNNLYALALSRKKNRQMKRGTFICIFFQKKIIWHFTETVPLWHNLNEMQNPILKKIWMQYIAFFFRKKNLKII